MVSIVVVTFNSEPYIQTCLDSILRQQCRDYEIIIVDNNSLDRTRAILKSNYPMVCLQENATNYGFSKACNQGIACARGEFILCLNHDVVLREDFLSSLIRAIEENERIGAVQSKVLKPDGRYVDTTGLTLLLSRRYYDIGTGKLDSPRFNIRRYVFGACAAAALYRKKALESVKAGGEYFDEDFFQLVEDIDISWRLQKKGWRILYLPNAVCTHARGISSSIDNEARCMSLRNKYLMILKNETLFGFLRFAAVFIVYDMWRKLAWLIIEPRILLKAWKEFMRLAPAMLRKRDKG